MGLSGKIIERTDRKIQTAWPITMSGLTRLLFDLDGGLWARWAAGVLGLADAGCSQRWTLLQLFGWLLLGELGQNLSRWPHQGLGWRKPGWSHLHSSWGSTYNREQWGWVLTVGPVLPVTTRGWSRSDCLLHLQWLACIPSLLSHSAI